ncbi:MAG: dihydroorotase [Flavobacteriales bacterium]|nr:dihydroorotase [Flavobacteriales bacterium]|tara:strand:+ start:1504 stop:2835 length:1332 start_codon:yes stop_codon:yes gene_type:complete
MITLIKQATIVNEGKVFVSDLLIEGERIKEISSLIDIKADKIINAQGKILIPGVIDDQVHFREPGLTHKAEIYTESKAAVAGGITSYMEMPNTNPQTLTQKLLEDKFEIASKMSLANFSFFMGVSNDNIEEVLATDPKKVGALKIFMGSSTGNMLVDNKDVLEEIFKKSEMLIAVHCEDESIIRENIKEAKLKYGENVPIVEHPNIRSENACYQSSYYAVSLAKKHNARLHVFHISTAKELELFDNTISLKDKRITSEVCVHHLWFDESDYVDKGTFIKWNPAVKSKQDKAALFEGLLTDKLDIIATDHAPHTLEEKNNPYFSAPSGGPLVQHALHAMLEFHFNDQISLEKIVEKMCHNPAICFQIEDRGYVREGYYADLVLIDLDKKWTVNKNNILYKCGWSPFEGHEFNSKVSHTIINGNLVYEDGSFYENKKGKRLLFNR